MQKKKRLSTRFTMLILLLVVLVVWVIVFINMEKPESHKAAKEEQYHNAYITKNEKDTITIWIEDTEKSFKMSESDKDFTGKLADISVKNGYVTKLYIKENTIHGKVLSVTDDCVVIEGYGKVKVTDDFKVYKSYSGIKAITTKQILVGYDVTNFYVEEDKICGAVVYKNIDADIIRVLLNTTGYKSIFHDSVVVSCKKDYKITYGKKTDTIKGGKDTKITKDSKYLKNSHLKIESVDNKSVIKIKTIERSYGNPEYEGKLYISSENEGLLIVNELELENYLYCVVPSEMPSSYGVEALEVQAICARTYGYRQILNNSYSNYGAHVDDSVSFQVYNNSKATDNSIKAVDNTYGKIITQNNEPIEAYFFSTSCGSTTNVEDAWGGKKIPFIKGRLMSNKKDNINLLDDKEFDKFIKSNYKAFDSEYPYYRWNITFTSEEVKQVAKNAGADIGAVKSIKLGKRGAGGVIKSLTITGQDDQVTISGELNIRKAFSALGKDLHLSNGDVSTTCKILPSAYFTIDVKKNSYKLYGGGYGHGIGMSQNSVKAMLEEGMSVEEIISFFYHNVEIEAVYE